jgi:hypothetical protein
MRRWVWTLAIVVAATPARRVLADVGLYMEPALLAGVRRHHDVEEGVPVPANSVTGVLGVRAAIGLRAYSTGPASLQAGFVIDYLAGANRSSVALGFELAADWDLATAPCWQLGPRFSIGYADDLHGEGPYGTVGIVARRGDLTFGGDVFGLRGHFRGTGDVVAYDGYTLGAIGHVGATGRTGKYTMLIGGGALLIVGAAIALALGSAPTH